MTIPNIIITREALSAQEADKETRDWERDYEEAQVYVDQGAPYSLVKEEFGDTGDTAMMAKGKMNADTKEMRGFIT